MIIVKYRWFILSLVAALAFLLATATSCVKEVAYLDDPSARLGFSCDTLSFDTVFATMGTTTRQVLVYNRHDSPMLIERVSLRGGSASRFRMNVDGDTSMVVRNLTIPAHDSIFIFVKANINPNSSTEPFLVEDAIDFDFGHSVQSLVLTAYGRNAVYHMPTMTLSDMNGNLIGYASLIDCANWDHSLPHVIVGYGLVANGDVLSLTAGDEVFMGNESSLLVLDGGSLRVSGTAERPVRFTSVRHDGWYDSLPGQWGYLWLADGSVDNQIDYAVIENGTVGLRVDTVSNANPTLKVTNTIIQNQQLYGILASGCPRIVGDNLLVTSCGSALVALNAGGNFCFSNSTFANFWRYGGRKVPAIAISNYYEYEQNGVTYVYVRDIERAEFHNCIIDGSFSLDGGGEVSLANEPSGQFNVVFGHCLLKSREAMEYSDHSLLCEDPRYVNRNAYDYHLREDSPAVGMGNYNKVSIPHDLDGTPRRVPPTVGAYEINN